MKLVFEFRKTGDLIYLSHLDLSRLFLRVLRMSGLKPAYSQGFNPHPKMSFALPLSLGLHSICELLEFETERFLPHEDTETAVRIVNERLPEGARVTAWHEKPQRIPKSLASYAAAATYEFMCDRIEDAPALLSAFFARESIVVKRPDKKTGEAMDREIRAEMLGCAIVKDIRGRMLAEATLSAAPGSTLNPTVFFHAFCTASGIEAGALSPVITRTAILGNDGRPLTEILL